MPKSEGLPISALEAMSAGLALILSDVGGCKSLIQDNGGLVLNNKEAIKEAIVVCMDQLSKYQFNSLRLFNERHNLSHTAKRYIEYYHSVLG